MNNGTARIPHNADWSWRPDVWREKMLEGTLSRVPKKAEFSRDVTVFHDCTLADMTLRQIDNAPDPDAIGYSLHLDVHEFAGSFVSFVLNPPDAARHHLKRSHILQIGGKLDLKQPLEVFARLNMRQGPNTEQMVLEMPLNQGMVSAEFDLSYSELTESQVDAIWVDLIFEHPGPQQITVHDLILTRRPRAQL